MHLKNRKKPRSSDQLYGRPTAGQQHAMGREGGQKVELKGTAEWHGRISNRNIYSGLSAVKFVIQVHSLQWCTWLTLSSPGTQREFSPSSAVCSEPGPSRTVAFCRHQHLRGLNAWIMTTRAHQGMDFRQAVDLQSRCLFLASWWNTTSAIQQLPNKIRNSKKSVSL